MVISKNLFQIFLLQKVLDIFRGRTYGLVLICCVMSMRINLAFFKYYCVKTQNLY